MRQSIVKVLAVVVMVAASFGLYSSVAHAEGNGSPYIAGDGRIDPMTGDRLAVYLKSDSVDVWGVDANNVGFDLTSFSLAELTGGKAVTHQTASGAVTLKLVSPATWHVGYSDASATSLTTIVDTGAVYSVTWAGGSGAGFSKTFSATYSLPQ